jgi:hypothetical protein
LPRRSVSPTRPSAAPNSCSNSTRPALRCE